MKAAPRRGCFGTIVSGGCGCSAFLIGAALAIAMAAPQLLSGWGARFLKKAIEARVDGVVEIYDLELSWRQNQRAGRVTLTTSSGKEDGKSQEVAEFALRFPSLFDLLANPSTEWKFRFTDAEITARVDGDGTSDLGRCLGLKASDGPSEIHALLAALSRGFAPEGEGGRRSIQTTIAIREARFIDMASGLGSDRKEATVSDLSLFATRSRVGFQVELREAIVHHHVSEEAHASFALNFGGPNGVEPVLKSATIHADAIPLDTLRLLGVMPRTGTATAGAATSGAATAGERTLAGAGRSAFPTRDAYASMAIGLNLAVESFLKEGARFDVTYGERTPGDASGAPEVGPESPAGAELSVRLAGRVGIIDLAAMHVGSQLVGEPAEGEDNSLDVGFRLPPRQLTRLLNRLVPLDKITFSETRPDAQWFLRSRQFQVPLAADALSVSRLFPRAAPLAEGPARRAATPRPVLARHIAEALRAMDGRFDLNSLRSTAAEVTLWPAGSSKESPFERLDWTHRLTTLQFSGELGVTARSRWWVAQTDEELAELSLAIPGTALSPGEDLSPRLDVRLPQVSLALLEAVAPLPQDLAGLLPRRFDRLVLQGVRLPQLLAGPSRTGRAGRGSTPPIHVVASLDDMDTIEGTYVSGTMMIPNATVSMPLDQLYCDNVIRAYMPWFAEVKPGEGGGAGSTLEISMRDFVFSTGTDEFEQEGEVELRSGPLRVKLHPVIANELSPGARELRSPDEDDSEDWIAWTPAPTLLSLDGLRVGYERVEVPLSDDYVATLEGQLYRTDNNYSLSGMVESAFIDGQAGGDALQVIAINGKDTAAGPQAAVTFARGTIDPDLAGLMRKAAEIGEKAK